MAPETLSDRVAAAKEIVRVFRAERMTYMLISLLAVGMLFTILWKQFTASDLSAAQLLAYFGSSGLIAVSAGRVLYMFNLVVKRVFLEPPPPAGAGEEDK